MTTRATSKPKNSFWRCRRCPEEGLLRPRPSSAPLFATLPDPLACVTDIDASLPPFWAPRPACQGHIERQAAPNQSP